jgi:hypothetical protein
MSSIKQDTTKTTKILAQQVAKKMAQEPLEILKQAGRQVGGTEKPEHPQVASETPSPGVREIPEEQKARIEMQSRRQLQALENELKDIQEQKRQQKLLKAEKEAQELEAQKVKEEQKPLPKIATKPSRRLFGFGPKAQVEKQKTRVEKPLPPSG